MIVLGIMSGTSLDGVDLALVDFTSEKLANYKLVKAITIPYSPEWTEKLKRARDLSGLELSLLNIELGKYFGEISRDFIAKSNLKPRIIASHGHTVFHQPQSNLTLQIGSLYEIASICAITTVGNFRAQDVAKGGEGAPLVPIGDELLFGNYDFCVNLGGISNYSYKESNSIKAKDITPCNIVVNNLCNQLGLPFDENGTIGEQGQVNNELLQALNNAPFYTSSQQSLGIELIEAEFLPLLEKSNLSVPDKLATFYEHIAGKIGCSLNIGKTLITGGGAKNKFLISRIKHYSKSEIIVPNEMLIDFKEAVIFALLGLLRVQNKTNVLSSVTGATSDSCSGDIVLHN